MTCKMIMLAAALAIVSACQQAGHPETSASEGYALGVSDSLAGALPAASYGSLTTVYPAEDSGRRELTWRDERLLVSRGTKTVYRLPAYTSLAEWTQRRAFLREQVLVSAGLWPLPPKGPLLPVYRHRQEHSDYTVETVTLTTFPGYLLSGNLYRPKGKGPFPAILTSHGHFPYGRLQDDSVSSVPGRCINLARQGFMVFAYDMVGYNDTRQVAHTFADDSLSRLYGINLLGLQLWNSMRALDFLCSLPETDSTRIGMTGASGGGTQTFLLAAVDDRIKAVAPVNMVSNTMQGGDLCENAQGLRINTFNVELAAMAAPRPMLLVSDTHDWTFNTRNTIMPMVRSVYALYGAEDRVTNRHFDFRHNYNRASREAVYAFFGRWLMGNDQADTLREQPFDADDDTALLAFMKARNGDATKAFRDLDPEAYHPLPNALDEAALQDTMKAIFARQLQQYWPAEHGERRAFDAVYGTALRHLVGAVDPDATEVKIMGAVRGQGFTATRLLIARRDQNDWIPCVLYQPAGEAAGTVIVTADEGKAHWVDAGADKPTDLVMALLRQHRNVLAPDLFKQGEHVLFNGVLHSRDEQARFFTTFNLTDRQEQVQDLMTVCRAMKNATDMPGDVRLLASGGTGLTALLWMGADSTAPSCIADATDAGNGAHPPADLGIPGIMRIGGLRTVLALAAQRPGWVYNAGTALTSGVAHDDARFRISASDPGAEALIGFLCAGKHGDQAPMR